MILLISALKGGCIQSTSKLIDELPVQLKCKLAIDSSTENEGYWMLTNCLLN